MALPPPSPSPLVKERTTTTTTLKSLSVVRTTDGFIGPASGASFYTTHTHMLKANRGASTPDVFRMHNDTILRSRACI